MQRWTELLSDPRFAGVADGTLEEARQRIATQLCAVATALPDAVREKLPAHASPDHGGFTRDLVDRLDADYFAATGAGETATAEPLFSAARYAAACLFYREALTRDDLMNAANEAEHARL